MSKKKTKVAEITVKEFIDKLNEIGYDDKTKLTFGFVEGESGEWYTVNFNRFFYGEELTGEAYNQDEINIDINVDGCKDYLNQKASYVKNDIIEALNNTLNSL